MAKKYLNNKFGAKKYNNSWQNVSKWYGNITKGEGHYYHSNIIIPKLLKLLNLNNNSSVLDLGCGSGILGRNIKSNIKYLGIDLSNNLISLASKQDKSSNHDYKVGNANNLELSNNKYTDIVFLLSFQNMERGEMVIRNASKHLVNGGKIVLVLNHPAFRIPRQSSWEIDPKSKIEYRRINKYMTSQKIPINMNPSLKNSEFTWSYHYPISEIVKYLTDNNLVISNIEEWVSDKESIGKNSKMENRARSEFPLFMAIVAKKQ